MRTFLPGKRRAAMVTALLACTLAIADPAVTPAAPVGTSFTYQGQLRNSGVPVGGSCSFIFRLWDAPTSGSQQGATLTYDGAGGNPAPLAVAGGLFTTVPPLDFGNQFNGDGRWLDIQVKCGADPGYTSLGRQQLVGSPYAISTTSLQGRPISQTAPSSNDVLRWNGAAWSPSAGPLAVADFYALMPPDNAATVGAGGDVDFPQDGPGAGAGITRLSADQFRLAAIGTYQVQFQVSVDEAGQLVVALDSGSGATELGYTQVGRSTGSSQIVGLCLVTTTVVDTTLSIRNPAGNIPALTITPFAGQPFGLPVSAHLLITRVD